MNPPEPKDLSKEGLLQHVLDIYKTVRRERGEIYGDPLENHRGIAQVWAPLLQPHWEAIKAGDPVPPHVVALAMVGLKLDRMRLAYSLDNYVDLLVYLTFAHDWQKMYDNVQAVDREVEEFQEEPTPATPGRTTKGWPLPVSLEKDPLAGKEWATPLCVYVSGPFSADTLEGRIRNMNNAVKIGIAIMKRGHHAHVPHAATFPMDGDLDKEQFMELDFTLIRRWADVLYRIGPSPGSDRELALAKSLSMPVVTSLDQLPDLAEDDVYKSTYRPTNLQRLSPDE